MLVPLALFGGFLNLYIALWNMAHGGRLYSTFPKVLRGFVTWGFFSILLDVSKILLSTSRGFRYTLAAAEGLETWIRSVPMALCLVLIVYAAVYEDKELEGMGGGEAIMNNAGGSEETVFLSEKEEMTLKIEELEEVV